MSVLDELFGAAPAGRTAIPTGSDLNAVRKAGLPAAGGAGFPDAVERLLAREGGYSDNPADRGGKTNFGISSKAYPNLDVSKLTREQARDIYKRDYWDAIGADQLDPSVREIAFDAAVNHGAGTARKMLEQSGGDPQRMLALRQKLYGEIAANDPTQRQFSKGWQNRLSGLNSVGTANAEAVPTEFPMPSARAERGASDDVLDSIFGGELPSAPAPEGEVTGSDYGRALAITGGDFVKAPVAALENVAGQLSGEGTTRTERQLAGAQRGLADMRRGIGEWQKGFFESMSPEAIDRAQRELLTLDPSKTAWQGGPKEFLSSMALKGTLSLGPTVGPMVTTMLLGRLGVGASASTLWGAQEGLMSAGLTAAQLADDIEQTPLDELRKVGRFAELERQLGEVEAKRQYTNEVQGVVPAITGLLVGSLSKVIGKPLDKVFGTGAGLPIGGRFGAGFVTEAAQEGPQSYVEQVMQNYAQMAYDSNINLLDGAAEAAVQGMLLGGPMGGTVAAMFGNAPQNRPLSSDPVPADIRAAMGAIPTEPPKPNMGTPPPNMGPGAAPPPPAPPGGPAPPTGGEELSLAPDPTSTLVGDRFAVSEDQRPGEVPFDAPDLMPTETVDFPQEEALTRGRRRKVTAPKTAIPLELETRPSEQPLPDIKPDLSPLDQAVAADIAAAANVPGWNPNEQPPQAPAPELTQGEAAPAGFEVNQQREPKHGTRPRTEQLGYRVRMRGPNGEILSSELFETSTQARLKGHQLERSLRGTNDGRFVEVLPARRTFVNEQTPTAEPVSDVLAQIKDMRRYDPLMRRQDPDARSAVYLTRETLDNLREAGQLDQALRGGIPIRNFDTYGGVLLAADEDVAQELMQLIEDPQSNIDEVIGYATGAGDGKPGGTNPVVQLLDADGNVIRERQVTPEEAPQTKAKWGPMARIMPLEQALAIRQNRMQREKAERTVAAEQQAFAATQPDQQVEGIFNENSMTAPLAAEAGAAARQGGFEEDIGGRLQQMAEEQRAEELQRRKVDKRFAAPEDVKFRGREVVERKQKETADRRRANALRNEVETLTAQVTDLKAQLKERDKAAAENKKRVKGGTYSDWLKKRAKLLPAGEQLEKLQQQVKDLTAEITALEEGAKTDKKSVEGATKVRGELSAEYEKLYGALRDAAIRVALAQKSGTLQDVTEAEAAHAKAADELKAFYEVEGGYTKAEAIGKAAARYSPKARRDTVRAIAKSRDERRAAKDAADEAKAEVTRPSRLRPGRIISVGDEAREEKKLQNIVEEQKVSVSEMAAQLDRIKKRVKTPEGKRLVENLFLFLSPTVGADLDQIIDQLDASEVVAKLDKLRASGRLSEKRYEWRKKLAERRADRDNEKQRAATANALIEIRQLLQQWLSDYRLALAQSAPAIDKSNAAIHSVRAAETAEMLSRLRAWHQGDVSIADDAARYLAHRISTFVVHGKRRGVAEEMDIDGFWEAVAKGPMAFRDYLADTVQSREDLPFPSDLTNEQLEATSIGALNALYVKAIEHLDGSRESDGQRRELVKAIKKAANARGLKLSDREETIEVELWDRKKHDWVTIKRRISPRKLFAETFRRSYGVRGADSRMSMEQLKDLYLNGATITVWDNGWVEFEDSSDKLKRRWRMKDESFKGKGKPKVIKLEPIAKELPDPQPLNVRARRVTPEKKRRVVMSAVRSAQRKQYGGKSQSTGLARTATSGEQRARAETKYSTGVLLEDTAPRDLGNKSAEYAARKERANEILSDAVSNASAYLSEMETAKYKKAAGDPQAYVHAKAYIRWVYEYGVSLSQANLKSWSAFKEMENVAADLMTLTALTPDKLVEEVEKRFRAEMNEQVFRTVALDPVNLKGLTDPKRRAEMTAESHDRVRKAVMFHKRLTEMWSNHPIFLQDIQPVLNRISESLAVRHRGIQESRGWPVAQFTDEERARVKAILEEWKSAKDLPLMAKGKLFQQWGVPADKLYDDFYLPLHEMLRNAGFLDPDEALLKQYNRKFTTEEDQSTGPVDVMILDERGMPMQRRFASVAAPDPVAMAATEVDRRNQERIDQQLVAMDDDEASDDDTTVVDRGVERPITEADRKRRKGLISSPLGKTAESARKLLRANEIIEQFRRTLYKPDANIRQIQLAESRMIEALREMGLWRDTGKGLGTIGIPDTTAVLAELEREEAELAKARASLETNRPDLEAIEGALPTESLQDSKYAKEIERIAEEMQASRDALETIREMQAGNKKARTIAYRRIGDRLAAGELTKEEARLTAGEKLTGFWVKADKAKRLGMEPAKTRGDELKERAKAAAGEKKRREGMSYEQRKAAESYDRLGYGDLKFDISTQQGDYGKASDAEYDVFFALRDRLAAAGSVPLGELLAFVGDKLGGDHTYQPIIRTLLKHAAHRRVPVRFSQDLEANNTGKLALEGNAPVILINEDAFMTPGFNPLRALHVVLHEAVHAATVRAMIDNKPATDALNMLRKLAREQFGDKFNYATSDVFEFVAEAYTNAEFQRALKATKIDSVKNAPLWNQFVTWVRNLLGFAPEYDNLLAAVMSLQTQTFGPEPYNRETARKVREFDFRDEAVSSLANSAFAQHEAVQDAISKAKSIGDNIKEGGQSFLLKALSMRQLEQFYSRYFGGEGNPLKKYMKAFEERNSYASALLEEADKLSRRWTAVEDSNNGEGVELSRIMHDATVQGVHADEAGSALNDRFRALSPAAQQLYKDVREYYKATQKREVQLMLANALRASKLWKGGEINAEEIDLEAISKGDWLQQKLGIDLKAQKAKLAADAKGLDAKAFKAREADIENTEQELKLIARMANIPTMNEGPYFPLMRFGDYAVKAERTVATEVYATRQERSEAMDRWQEKDPTLQFSFPKTDEEGAFPLTVREVEFRLAETRAEAAQSQAELVAEYGKGNVTPVQLKRNLINNTATIDSNRALQTLLGKLDGNAAAQAALREFYIKSLSDRSFRKREAKRKNYRGADPTKQHRTFGAYSKSASYYTSQLKYGHVMADAKAEMRKVSEAHRDESQISAVRMGQIVQEIEIRDNNAASLTDVSPVVRRAVETGQLWLLLSPSYWMINATQPWMVTTPWLAGHSDMVTATKALAEAQALILDPLVTQGVQSWGGIKAIKSRLAAEQAFGVLENVEKAIAKKYAEQGKDPQPVLDMLTALKRESIIDLSFVAELRDIAEGQDKGAWDKVMDASRVLAHLTEVNNRIMTALAAYNVAKGKGLGEQDATDFAKRAVAETQFDYSAANKPRLFSANDAWWKPLVFQFMQYVQHMYVLFIRHAAMWWNAPRGSAEARLGRRVVLGLLATHVAAGGILGATPQLAKWAIGLVMMLLGAGDDEDRNFKNWVSGDYYNRMMTDAVDWLAGNGKAGEAIRAGLPRLAGFDLSSRLAFLQTYMIDIDAKSSETLYGSLVSSFGGPMFGIAGNAFDAAQLALEGDADKAWEKLLPKLGRDAVRAARYWQEGMVDNTGKTVIGANEMSPWEIFLTSMGFQPSQIAETYARNSRAREAEAFVSRRKAEITAAYRKARSTGETNSVMADLREFNKQFPQDRITMSQLLRGMREMRKSERNIQRYGVDAGKRSAEYTDDSYNVE